MVFNGWCNSYHHRLINCFSTSGLYGVWNLGFIFCIEKGKGENGHSSWILSLAFSEM